MAQAVMTRFMRSLSRIGRDCTGAEPSRQPQKTKNRSILGADSGWGA